MNSDKPRSQLYSINTISSKDNLLIDDVVDVGQFSIQIPQIVSPFQGSEWKQVQNNYRMQSSKYLSSPSRASKSSFKSINKTVTNQQMKFHMSSKEIQEEQITLNYANQDICIIPLDIQIQCLGIVDLDLRQNNFQTIPIELLQMTQIKRLNLSQNFIQQIPNYVSQMKSLQVFNLRHNKIKLIPIMMQLPSLRDLDLCYNLIDHIPPEFCRLRLIHLGLKANPFVELPYQFNQMLITIQYNNVQQVANSYSSPTMPTGILGITDESNWLLFQEMARKQEEKQLNITYPHVRIAFQNNFCDPCRLDQNGRSLLFNYIESDSLGLIVDICQRFQALLHLRDKLGEHPLMYCYGLQQTRSLLLLIGLYDSSDIIIGQLLIVAVKKSDDQIVKILLQKGVDVNFQTPDNIQLVQFGFSSKNYVSQGSTALHMLMSTFGRNTNQQAKAARIGLQLLQFGADPNIKNEEGWSPLHLAIKQPSLSAVKWIHQYNADCKSSNNQMKTFDFCQKGGIGGNTPFHIAAQMGLVGILQLISQSNGDPFIHNNQGYSAKFICASSLQIIKLLRKLENVFILNNLFVKNDDKYWSQSKNENLQHLSPMIERASAINSIQKLNDLSSENRSETVKCDEDVANIDEMYPPNLNLSKLSVPSVHRSTSTRSKKLSQVGKDSAQSLSVSRLTVAQISLDRSQMYNKSLGKVPYQNSSRFDELNDLYKEIGLILKRNTGLHKLLQELEHILYPNARKLSYKAQSSSRTTNFFSQLSIRQKDNESKYLNLVLQSELIVPAMMCMILFKCFGYSTLASSSASATIMLINQLDMSPTTSLPMLSLQGANNLKQTNSQVVNSVQKFQTLKRLTPQELQSDLMRGQRNQFQNTLAYDLRNPQTNKDRKLQELLYKSVLLEIQMIKVDQLFVRRDSELDYYNFIQNSRMNIIDYEMLQLKELMKPTYKSKHSRQVEGEQILSDRSCNTSHDWFGNLTQKLQLNSARASSNLNITKQNLSSINPVNMSDNSNPATTFNNQNQYKPSDSKLSKQLSLGSLLCRKSSLVLQNQSIKPTGQEQILTPQSLRSQVVSQFCSIKSSNLRNNKSEFQQEATNDVGINIKGFIKNNSRHVQLNEQSKCFRSPYSFSNAQKTYKELQKEAQMVMPSGDKLNRNNIGLCENLSESEQSILDMRENPQTTILKRLQIN